MTEHLINARGILMGLGLVGQALAKGSLPSDGIGKIVNPEVVETAAWQAKLAALGRRERL